MQIRRVSSPFKYQKLCVQNFAQMLGFPRQGLYDIRKN